MSFKGLEHRLEFVLEMKGKKFFNDSKATNPESSIVALKAFDEEIIWLAGGHDKLTSLKDLSEEAKRKVSSAIFYGEAASRFEEELLKSQFAGKIFKVNNLDTALEVALEQSGQIVLLSPACASFDQFKNFEERGQYFKTALNHKKSSDCLVNLVGRYEKHREGHYYRDEEDDLHIISVDPQDFNAFIDFNASPEWVNIKIEAAQIILDNRFIIDVQTMTYREKP